MRMNTIAKDPANAPKPQSPAPPEVMDAKRLVDSLIADLPSLGPVRVLVEHVAALISYKRLGVDINTALQDLEVAGIRSVTLVPAIEKMGQSAEAEAASAAKYFADLTGRDINPDTLNPGPATKEEIKEQEHYKAEALKLRGRVDVLRRFYFGESPQRGKVEQWLQAAREKLEKAAYKEETVSHGLPGWKTPPKLDEANPEVALLFKQIALFENAKAILGNSGAAFEHLKNLKFTPERVKEILDAADFLAQDQMIQSQTISALAEDNKDAFIARVAKIASVRQIVTEARNYLDSPKAKK